MMIAHLSLMFMLPVAVLISCVITIIVDRVQCARLRRELKEAKGPFELG